MYEQSTQQSEEIRITFAEFIERVAAKAHLNVKKQNPTLVLVPFDMGEGRHQNVFVRPLCRMANGNLIIGFSSPALKMPMGQLLSQKAANDLLRDNAKLAHGSWAIETMDGSDYLVAYDTQISQTMQPEEFEASVRALSVIADDMEKKFGVDAF